MRYQSRHFTCGPAAICNALEVYGVYKSEDEVSKLCGTTTVGTRCTGLVRAINKMGFNVVPLKLRDGNLARTELENSVAMGAPSILCVDNWQHWITLVGEIGLKAVVIDAANENLQLFPSWSELVTRWKHTGSRYEGYKITL